MSTRKTRYLQLDYFGPGDQVSDDDWKFGTVDRDRVDLVAMLGASLHRHDGASLDDVSPTLPLALVLDHDAGVLPAGSRIYYKYTLVDSRGFETLASPEVFIQTPAAIVAPSAPILSLLTTGGILLPGSYNYALSAYTDANTLETTAPASATRLVPVGSNTNKITLTLPALPAGADGFNVYRRQPGESTYHFLASVDMQVATPPSTYVDDGTVADNCDRGLPPKNTTNEQNEITVSLPGATATVPVGYTWRLYRTIISGQYSNSLLRWVVEETAEGSGIITPHYTDLGYATSSGQPPTTLLDIPNPDPINLTDAVEIEGVAPPANTLFEDVVEFAFPGLLAIKVGTFAWHCPYEEALIEYVVISLGRGASAAGTDVIVDVNKYNAQLATPTWGTIFTTQANRPRVIVGHSDSAHAIPDVVSLLEGDKLTVDIDQVGNAATRIDADLLIQIKMWYRDSAAASIVFP